MVKLSSTVKSLLVSVGLLAAFLTTAFSFDGRYLHVADFKQYVGQKERRELEDKIFALELKKNLDAKDRAFLNRYKRQLDELNKELKK